MDKSDQALLEKQFRVFNQNQRSDSKGTVALTAAAVFFAGLAIGGFLVAYQTEPMRVASNVNTPFSALIDGWPQPPQTQ